MMSTIMQMGRLVLTTINIQHSRAIFRMDIGPLIVADIRPLIVAAL